MNRRGTYDTRSVSVPPMRVIHRRNVNSTPVHNIIIRNHDPREWSQEHSVSAHKGEESLDTKCDVSSVELTWDRDKTGAGNRPT